MTTTDQNVSLLFRDETTRLASDFDVLMCYQIFLGRNPETSFVVQESKSHPLRKVVTGFLQSQEFLSEVYYPIREGKVLPHEILLFSPSRQQLHWLCGCFSLTEQQSAGILSSRDWRGLFSVLLKVIASITLPGVEEERGAAAASEPRDPEPERTTFIANADEERTAVVASEPRDLQSERTTYIANRKDALLSRLDAIERAFSDLRLELADLMKALERDG